MRDEGHRALKRWERARQLAGIEAEPVLRGPLADCRIRLADGRMETLPVHVIAVYAGDFAFVKAANEPVPAGLPGPEWMVRGGISWETFFAETVRHYRAGVPVSAPMSPVRKLPGELLARLQSLPNSALPEVFAKLRETGLLPAWPVLARETCPPGLPWEDMRARFQDFALPAGRSPKDNPPR